MIKQPFPCHVFEKNLALVMKLPGLFLRGLCALVCGRWPGSPNTRFSEPEVGDKRSLQDNTSPKNRNGEVSLIKQPFPCRIFEENLALVMKPPGSFLRGLCALVCGHWPGSPNTQFSELEVGDKRSLEDDSSLKNRN